MLRTLDCEDLVAAWEYAAERACSFATLAEWLPRIRDHWPIRSILVYALDPASRSLPCAGAATIDGTSIAGIGRIPCSEAKWAELLKWTSSGELLRQVGGRRSGKLALLTPESITGETLAMVLTGRNEEGVRAPLGIAVVEIEYGRLLGDESARSLQRWAGPLGLMLRHWIDSQPSQNQGPANHPPTAQDDPKVLREIIVGADSGLRAVMERVQLVASSDMPVLILGDTGTGKEVVARAIHLRSPRSSRPFLRVNCGAIPPELIDSQLFGHERGSFTGASDQRKGWFERADGGTLFLDEIGELPLAAQVRLLRVLQEKQIERVGGQETIHVDVRIVAATHRDLASMVHDRTFREDLWYRINMFPILLPRLCERIEDIPALAKHFARKAAISFGFPFVEPSTSDIERLVAYSWPGNIRELQAVMDRAVILGRGIKLDIAAALGTGIAPRPRPPEPSDEPTFYEVIPESFEPTFNKPAPPANAIEEHRIESLNESIKRHIERALVVCQGQIEGKRGAAQWLQINPHTLRAKMRKLGIRWSDYRRD